MIVKFMFGVLFYQSVKRILVRKSKNDKILREREREKRVSTPTRLSLPPVSLERSDRAIELSQCGSGVGRSLVSRRCPIAEMDLP